MGRSRSPGAANADLPLTFVSLLTNCPGGPKAQLVVMWLSDRSGSEYDPRIRATEADPAQQHFESTDLDQ